jgi:hypothetical protein
VAGGAEFVDVAGGSGWGVNAVGPFLGVGARRPVRRDHTRGLAGLRWQCVTVTVASFAGLVGYIF